MNLPGLNHQLGEDIDALRDAVRTFVAKELAPIAADVERENTFPAPSGRSWATWACTA